MNALIRFHFKIEPTELSEEEFAMRWQELQWVLKEDSKRWHGK